MHSLSTTASVKKHAETNPVSEGAVTFNRSQKRSCSAKYYTETQKQSFRNGYKPGSNCTRVTGG